MIILLNIWKSRWFAMVSTVIVINASSPHSVTTWRVIKSFIGSKIVTPVIWDVMFNQPFYSLALLPFYDTFKNNKFVTIFGMIHVQTSGGARKAAWAKTWKDFSNQHYLLYFFMDKTVYFFLLHKNTTVKIVKFAVSFDDSFSL